MKLLFYLTVFGIFLSGINSHRLARQTSENDIEAELDPTEVAEIEPNELEEEEADPTEPAEMEELEPTEPAELEEESEQTEPAELEEELEPTEAAEFEPSGAELGEQELNGGEQAGSVLNVEDNSSEEAVAQGATINNQNAELAGGDSSQEVEGGIQGGAGIGGSPVSSEEVVDVGTQPIPTEFIQSTAVYGISTGNPLQEATTYRFENRGDAFFADFGPQEGAKNEIAPQDSGESSTSPQKIGLIVGATTAGTVAVAAGLAIAYVKLKAAGAGSAGAA